MNHDDAPDGPVRVDHRALRPDTLRRLVEEFVTRDGTDYGEVEVDLEARARAALAALEAGEVVIVFDPATSSVTLVFARDAPLDGAPADPG
jgi:uncharacterized protein YheU (UPF0270 family)